MSDVTPTETLEPTVPVVEPVVEPTVTEPTVPAVEPVVEPVIPTVPEESPFETTGNEYIDDAMQMMHKGGVDLEKAFSKVFETNDPADIDMEYLNSVLGEAAAFGLVEGLKAENDKLESYAAEEVTKINEAVGGPDNWVAICDWIGSGESGMTAEDNSDYNKMLSNGGKQAELAAKELHNMFKQSPGYTIPAVLVQGATPAQPGQLEHISRTEYSQEYSKIVRTEGEQSPKLALLDKRRTFSMSKGM